MRTVIGIATMQGRETYLQKTLESLQGQGAIIEVYHNHKQDVDYTDNGKFEPLHRHKEPIYFLSCDDDIIYPPTYVNDMKQAIDKHGCIVTHHGRILQGVGLHYYRGHVGYRCGSEVTETRIIDVAGTGVTGFRTDYFNPIDLYKSTIQRMSDLIFSYAAAKAQKQIMVLPHAKEYFTIQDVPLQETIYGQEVDKCTVQNQIADAIYRIKKGLQ